MKLLHIAQNNVKDASTDSEVNTKTSWRLGMPQTRSGRLFLCAVAHGTLLILICLGISALLMRG